MQLGKTFQTINKLWMNEQDLIAEIEGDAVLPVIDGSLQAITSFRKDKNSLCLPVGIDRLISFSEVDSSIRIHARLTHVDDNGLTVDIDLFSVEGKPILQIQGLHMRITNQSRLEGMLEKKIEAMPVFYQIQWQQKPIDASEDTIKGHWVIVSQNEETIEGLQSPSFKPEQILKEVNEDPHAMELYGLSQGKNL